jgi:hypothetical protein
LVLASFMLAAEIKTVEIDADLGCRWRAGAVLVNLARKRLGTWHNVST